MTGDQATAVEEALSGLITCPKCKKAAEKLVRADPFARGEVVSQCELCWADIFHDSPYNVFAASTRIEFALPGGIKHVVKDRYGRYGKVPDDEWAEPYHAH